MPKLYQNHVLLTLFSLQVPEMHKDSCTCAAVSVICFQQHHVAGLVQVCHRWSHNCEGEWGNTHIAKHVYSTYSC